MVKAKRKDTQRGRRNAGKTIRYVVQERGNPATSGNDESKFTTVQILQKSGKQKAARFISKKKATAFQNKYENASQNAIDEFNMETRIRKIGGVKTRRKARRKGRK